jgi:hypothetical protein
MDEENVRFSGYLESLHKRPREEIGRPQRVITTCDEDHPRWRLLDRNRCRRYFIREALQTLLEIPPV